LGGGMAGLRFASPLISPALAASHDGLQAHNFIFCYFSGGWDILLGLDPRDPALFRDDNRAETRIQPGYDQLSEPFKVPFESKVPGIWFGPYMGKLADYADKMTVIRGMSMDTLTHQAGRRRFLTGKPPSGIQARGSSMSSVISGVLGPVSPVVNLSARVESFNVDQPNFASALTVATVDDLLRALRKGEISLESAEDEQIATLLNTFQSCRREERSAVRGLAHDARSAASNLVDANLDRYFDFNADNLEMEIVRSRYGLSGNLSTPNAGAAMAVAAITNGISRVVSVEIASGLDTHYDNWTDEQGPNQQAGFDLVHEMVKDLSERPYPGNTSESWLDHTTVIGFSEFARTAMLNATSGRDHSLTNACFLLGAGIKGGQVIGASSDFGMSPQPVNLSTGQVESGGEIIRPEHIHRTLLEMVGVTEDIADLRVPSIPVLKS
jgi:hypothetical protein